MKASSSFGISRILVWLIAVGFAHTAFAAGPENYTYTTSSGASIVPGTDDTGVHSDDGTTGITLPFPVIFYDQVFTTANVDSNGFLYFTSNSTCCTVCLPNASVNNVVAPGYTDLRTDGTNSEGATCGIFTSVSGTTPNRIFNIEWVDQYYPSGGTVHFEARLYESQRRIDFIYATVGGGSGGLGGVGVQRDTGSQSTTVSCNAGAPAAGTQYIFTIELTVTGTTIQSAVGNNFSGTVANFYTTRSDAVASDFTASIDWGDGTAPSAGTVSGGPGNGPYSVSGSHTYQTAGKLTTSITVTDTTDSANDTGTGLAYTSCIPAPADMVGWWPGDGNADDIQGTNNGALTNGATATGSGKVGQAFSFDGVNAWVEVAGDVGDFGSRPFTVDFWMKSNNDGGSDPTFIMGKNNANGGVGWDIRLSNNRILVTGVNGWAFNITSDASATTGVWHHIALASTDTTVNLYIDGVLKGTCPRSTITSTANPFRIGYTTDFASPAFNGLIDEVEIFNRALSAEEVLDLYSAGSFGKCKCTPPPSGLVSWWPGDNSAIDIQNSNHGTLKNGATFAAGKVGQAFSFAANGYIDVPYNQNLDPPSGQVTVDAWVNPASVQATASIVNKRTGANNTGYTLEQYATGDGTVLWNIVVEGSAVAVISNVPLPLHTWTHIAGTYDGTTSTLYFNGTQVGSSAVSGTIGPSPTAGLQIARNIATGTLFDGGIDEVEIFDRALTQPEIQAIYDAGNAGKCKAVVFYVSNYAINTIEKFDAAGTDLGLFANSGMNGPTTLVFDVSGNLYVANDNSSTIEKFDSEGIPTLFANSGLSAPYGLTFDANGNLYAANVGGNYIEKFDSSGADQGLFANSGMNSPTDLAFDAAGNLYVVNNTSNNIRKFDSAGTDLGVFASSGLNGPVGLTFDPSGNLYVSNHADNTIEKFDSAGTDLGVFGSWGGNGFWHLVRDASGNFYVVNANNSTIEKFDTAGTATPFASAPTANLNVPTGIAIRQISPSATPAPTPEDRQLVNISSRASVGTGDNVAIGGFIIHSDPTPPPVRRGTSGSPPNTKRVLIRGIGPSLSGSGVPSPLLDPVLELHNPNGSLLTTNDNWRDTQETEIQATGLAPSDDHESAIVATLNADAAYTAILMGAGGTSGIGLVEVYDLDPLGNTHLANISTRAFVSTGDDVLIGGVIIRGGTSAQVVLRAIGPSLSSHGVSGALADPQLDIHDAQGTIIAHNDNWKEEPDGTPNPGRESSINATGLAPTNDSESAILLVLPPGNYTAIVSGVGATTGVGLVEAYNVSPPPP